MARLKCSFCNKGSDEESRSTFAGKVWVKLSCGHTIIKDALAVEDFSDMISSDGKTPFPFQLTTAEFAEKADCNFVCGHEQGLGKTIIECLLLKRHFSKLTPALIVVKSGLRLQWMMEIFRWTGHAAQIIESSKDKPQFDYFEIFIISHDTLANVRPVLDETAKELAELQEKLGVKVKGKRTKSIKWDDEILKQFKHICIDETHKFKNPSAQRSRSLREIWNVAGQPRVATYSGTDIMNRPSEYYMALSLVRPMLFPTFAGFCTNHVRYSKTTGKEVGLYRPEEFKELTKDFVIRFKREDVLPDLPKIFRQFRLADMDNDFIEVYKRTVKEFQEFMDIEEKKPDVASILGWMARMRHITGMAKMTAATEFVEEFLLESERKLTIFVHHKEVGKALTQKLSMLMKEGAWEPPLVLSSELDMRARAEVIDNFKKPEYRILIASTQASAEGLNLQFCSDCLFIERQWNPATEEQAEGRFPRPGSTADKINAHYLIAAGTIDEFLTELVEKKRAIVGEVLDGKESMWFEHDLVRDLSDAIVKKGLRKWQM